MKRIKRMLPIATAAILLPAASIVGPAIVWAETTNASSASTATTTSPDIGGAKTPADLLRLLGERIKARDVDGIIALQEPEAAVVTDFKGTIVRGRADIRTFYLGWFKSDPVLTVNARQIVVAGGRGELSGVIGDRTASVMGDYTLEQTGDDGTRVKFSGNFCDTVHEQWDGTWLYVQDNPYPPHGTPPPGTGPAHAHH